MAHQRRHFLSVVLGSFFVGAGCLSRQELNITSDRENGTIDFAFSSKSGSKSTVTYEVYSVDDEELIASDTLSIDPGAFVESSDVIVAPGEYRIRIERRGQIEGTHEWHATNEGDEILVVYVGDDDVWFDRIGE